MEGNEVGNSRTWLFRGLVVIGAALMVATWLMDWWVANVQELNPRGVVVHPWGLGVDLSFATPLVDVANMPAFFAPLMWAYLVICLAVLAFSLFAPPVMVGWGKLKLSLPTVLIGGVGVSYVVCAAVAVVVMSVRMGEFFGGIPLQGQMHYDFGSGMGSEIYTSLQIGYWLVYVAGAVLIALSLLRDKILGTRPA
jgi:hypothetical protein